MILTAVGDGDGEVGSSSWQTRGLIARRLSEIKNITKLPVTMYKNARANPVQTCMHTNTCAHWHTGISHAREREGSSQQPASNRGKKKHTTNLSKQLFIRVFNAKDKNKNKSCRIESNRMLLFVGARRYVWSSTLTVWEQHRMIFWHGGIT